MVFGIVVYRFEIPDVRKARFVNLGGDGEVQHGKFFLTLDVPMKYIRLNPELSTSKTHASYYPGSRNFIIAIELESWKVTCNRILRYCSWDTVLTTKN